MKTSANLITIKKLKNMLTGALSALEKAEDEVNKLNVFPVPDGDTGTNMKLTLKAVVDEVERAGPGTLKEFVNIMIRSSLLGARGNSGVILSQIVKGTGEEINRSGAPSQEILAKALMKGSAVAYEAVRQPVEGTILTVIKDIAAAAKAFRSEENEEFLANLAVAAHRSVAKTPDLLPVLRQSGVVDAGGYGLAVIFDGLLAAWRGEEIEVATAQAVNPPAEVEDLTYRYCTEFVLEARDFDPVKFEARLEKLGGSLLFVGEDGTYRVHIHTNTPGKVIDMATVRGSISAVAVHNLVLQSRERADQLAAMAAADKIGLVAVAAGDGVKAILGSLGVKGIVDGGQTANPSTADILSVIERMPVGEVIILPNNKNIILTAKQAADMSKKRVAVVPTRSIPEAFAALLLFASEVDLIANQEAMSEAAKTVKSLAVTRAIREAKGIKKGDWLGLSDDKVIVAAHSLETAALNLLSEIISEEDEILTILTGRDLIAKKAEVLEIAVRKNFPSLEIEIKSGGQPLYPLIMGLE